MVKAILGFSTGVASLVAWTIFQNTQSWQAASISMLAITTITLITIFTTRRVVNAHLSKDTTSYDRVRIIRTTTILVMALIFASAILYRVSTMPWTWMYVR